MKNVREIRKKDNMYFVLSDNVASDKVPGILSNEIAIILCLYYVDTLERYFEYIEKIPANISVYVLSSNSKVFEVVENTCKRKDNIFFVNKENRGRDISALLVASREIVLRHKYVCFVHDKKEHDLQLKNDVELWVQNLWDNTVKSAEYISNVLNVFSQNKNIGLLVPPEPVGEYINTWYMNNAWGKNYDNTKQLAENLGLVCDISPELSPITIGTTFWCRVDALKKLFEKQWNYDDFDEEPLANDGTLSHAIERIFAYVAQDAGYDTGTIMTTSYAAYQMNFLQHSMESAGKLLNEELGVKNIREMHGFSQRKERILEFCSKNQYVYLYGAGVRGKGCLQLLRTVGYRPSGFVVSDGTRKTSEIDGLAVRELNEIENVQGMGIIVCVGELLKEEIISELEKRGLYNYIVYIDV